MGFGVENSNPCLAPIFLQLGLIINRINLKLVWNLLINLWNLVDESDELNLTLL